MASAMPRIALILCSSSCSPARLMPARSRRCGLRRSPLRPFPCRCRRRRYSAAMARCGWKRSGVSPARPSPLAAFPRCWRRMTAASSASTIQASRSYLARRLPGAARMGGAAAPARAARREALDAGHREHGARSRDRAHLGRLRIAAAHLPLCAGFRADRGAAPAPPRCRPGRSMAASNRWCASATAASWRSASAPTRPRAAMTPCSGRAIRSIRRRRRRSISPIARRSAIAPPMRSGWAATGCWCSTGASPCSAGSRPSWRWSACPASRKAPCCAARPSRPSTAPARSTIWKRSRCRGKGGARSCGSPRTTITLFLQKTLLFKFALPAAWVSDAPAP